MFSMMVIFIALIAAVLILVVLLQSGQGGGLSGIAQSGTTRQVLGTRQAPDVLEKATWTLGAIFITLCVLSNFFIGGEEKQESVIQKRAQESQQQQAPSPSGAGQDAAPLPGQGGGAQQGGAPQQGGN
ncbi:MAG: preprotein translocase subunit SecG [Bacteroidetes bacterium SW_9_63_38]|nr:MAG: preprotein translocase subunit SecG [Bacteroidetes bacterium SW_9_63_38]